MKRALLLLLLAIIPGWAEDSKEFQNLRAERDRLIQVVLKLEADFARSLENYANLQTTFADLNNRPGTPDQRALVADLQKRLDQAVAQLRTMDEVTKTSSQKTAEALKKVIEGELAKLNQALGGERVLLKQAEERLAKLEGLQVEVAALEGKLSTAQNGRALLEAQLKELKADKEALTKQVEGLLARISTSEKERNAAEDEAILLKAKVRTLTARSEDAMKAAADVRRSLELKTAEAARLEQETKALRAKVAKHEARFGEALTENGQLTEEAKKLQAEKEKLTSQLTEREGELKEARRDLGRLQLQLEAGKKQMYALKVRLAKVSPVRYAVGEADVQDQQERVLREMRDVLGIFSNARFEIIGHTCDLGSAEANQKLSAARADALRVFLIENGINETIVKSRGMADRDPMVPNTSERNRQKNRRVEVEILD